MPTALIQLKPDYSSSDIALLESRKAVMNAKANLLEAATDADEKRKELLNLVPDKVIFDSAAGR